MCKAARGDSPGTAFASCWGRAAFARPRTLDNREQDCSRPRHGYRWSAAHRMRIIHSSDGTHHATSAQPAASQTGAAPESIPSPNNEPDKTADFTTANANAPWVGQIKSVTETKPGRIRVDTSVVDPRGANGSEAAVTAIAICESTVALFGPSYVTVLEDDGTNFVLFGHPSVPKGACTEV